MPSGYTFDSMHGPGIGMSSAGSSGGSSSSGSGGFSHIRDVVKRMASEVSNIASTSGSLVGDKVREILQNPATSAQTANTINQYDIDYGLGFDMDEYYDKLMDLAGYNNDWSASQAGIDRDWQARQADINRAFQRASAREAMNFEAKRADIAMAYNRDMAKAQMAFQARSDRDAMAWSAQEAAKSRKWTENMSNNAHRREVQDLLAAGLNPILSANGGAWSGSGAVGQGFSSSGASGSGVGASGHSSSGSMGSGAMGQTDMSISGALSALFSGTMTTARDLAITKMQTATQRYNTDMQYAMQKMAAETSIFNNNNNIDANKAIRALDRDADLRKASISADATRAAAASSAGAIISAANTSASAARYSAEKHLRASEVSAEASRYSADKNYSTNKYRSDKAAEASNYAADKNLEGDKYKANSNWWTNPVGYGELTQESSFGDAVFEVLDAIHGLGSYAPFK